MKLRDFADALHRGICRPVRSSHEYIVLAGPVPQHRTYNFRHLRRGFSFAKNHLGETLANRAVVIYLGEANIFKREMLDPLHRGFGGQFSAFHRFQ